MKGYLKYGTNDQNKVFYQTQNANSMRPWPSKEFQSAYWSRLKALLSKCKQKPMSFKLVINSLSRRNSYIFTLIMTQSFTSVTDAHACKRLLAVSGAEGKQNDVIVCGPESSGGVTSKQHIIFFGGDVQVGT